MYNPSIMQLSCMMEVGSTMCTTMHALPGSEHHAESKEHRKQLLLSGLNASGQVVTPHRAAIVDLLSEFGGHICAPHLLEMIHERYPSLRMNKTTLYRNLDALVALGLVNELNGSDGCSQYEVTRTGDHGHIVCVRCGSVSHVDREVLQTLTAHVFESCGFTLDLAGYPISGLCPACRSNN